MAVMREVGQHGAVLTYKYRLKGKRSVRLLRAYARTVNYVWNYCVEMQRKAQRAYRGGLSTQWLSKFDFRPLTAGTSAELGIHAQTIQEVSDRFVKSRDQHRKCPRFRASSGPKKALGWVPFQAQSRTLGPNFVRYRKHDFHFFGAKRRPLPDVVKGGCFVEDARGRWWVCLVVHVPNDQQHGVGSVGIDLGLKTLAALSDGSTIETPRTFRRWEAKLASAQRAGRKNRVRAIHEKIANIRCDHHHKASTRIVGPLYDAAGAAIPGETCIWDVNQLAGPCDGWAPLAYWDKRTVPVLTRGIPRATGGWRITHAIEVQR